MFKFAHVLATAFAGHHVRMVGWRNKFHLEVDAETYTIPVLIRVADDGSSRFPWGSVTESDMTGEWIFDGREPNPTEGDPGWATVPALVEGSAGWAIDGIFNGGHSTAQVGWPEEMSLEPHFSDELGQCIRLALPNGKRVLWRPAPQDLVARYIRR